MKTKLLLLLAFLFPIAAFAQDGLPMPRVSPQASFTQHLGNYVRLDVNYSRPAAKGRQVWGELIKVGLEANYYGSQKPMPWRMGANETTVLTISQPAKVNGKDLAAGSYSLHLILNESNTVTLIFNKNTVQWGSFFYDESEDVLRVDANLVDLNTKLEWFTLSAEPSSETDLTLSVAWGDKKSDFVFGFDVNTIALKEIDNLLTGVPGFFDKAWGQAAQFVLSANLDVDKGIYYADQATKLAQAPAPHFFTKSLLLTKKDDQAGSLEAEKAGLNTATDLEVNRYAMSISSLGDNARALALHENNAKKNSKSWIAFKGLADMQAKMMNKKAAKSAYEKSLKLAPDSQKPRIQKALDAVK